MKNNFQFCIMDENIFDESQENVINEELICPISMDKLKDPITVPCCGRSFERDMLVGAFAHGNTNCPNCRAYIPNFDPATAPKTVVLANLLELFAGKNKKKVEPKIETVWTSEFKILQRETNLPQTNKTICRLTIECNSKDVVSGSKTLLMMVVDRSGSMGYNPNGKEPIEQARYALVKLTESIKHNTSVIPYIMAYCDTVEHIPDPSKLKLGGGTNFVAAFNGIIDACKKYINQIENMIVVFLTDGQSGQKESQQLWINNFKNTIYDFYKKPLTIHSVGFGQQHDFNFLENIRKAGTVEGCYRYADPNDDNDSLSDKLNSITDKIISSSVVPIEVIIDNKSHKVFLDNHKVKLWLHEIPKQVKLVYDNNTTDINIEPEYTCDYNIWMSWYSILIDKLIEETIELDRNKGAYSNEDLNIYGQLLIRKGKSIVKFVSIPPAYEIEDKTDYIDPLVLTGRVNYIFEIVKQILAGKEIDKMKLNDAKYEGQFATVKTDQPKKPIQQQAYIYNPPIVQPPVYQEKFEPKVYKFRMNKNLNVKFRNGGGKIHDAICKERNNNIPTYDIYCVDDIGNSALALAASMGRCRVVEKFLNIDVSGINNLNDHNETALDLAIMYGHWNTVETLLQHGAKINLSSEILLHSCLVNKYTNTAEKMIKYNLVNITQDLTRYFKDTNIIQWIMKNIVVDGKTRDLMTIQKGLESNINKITLKEYKFSTYPEIFSITTDGHIQVVRHLLENGIASATELWTDGDGDVTWPLFIACEKGQTAMASLLIEFAPEMLNRQNNKGTTPLWIASCNKHIDIVSLLLTNGADPNICNFKGDSPLVPACQKGADMIVLMLLDFEINLKLSNKNRDNVILICCRNGQSKILDILLNECNKLGILNEMLNFYAEIDGFCPILASTELDKVACIEVLCKYGANVEHKTELDNKILAGATSMHLACFYGNLKSVQTLHKLGADLNAVMADGKTPLHLAIKHKHIDIVRYLINNNVKQIPDNDNNTPSYYASIKGNEDIYYEFYQDPFNDLILQIIKSKDDKSTAFDILKKHGQSIGCYDYEDILKIDCGMGMDLLTMAILKRDDKLKQALESMGASYTYTDKRGLTPGFWKSLIANDMTNIAVNKVATIMKSDVQNKIMFNLNNPPIEFEELNGDTEIITRMNIGYNKQVSETVLARLEKSSARKHSLLGFIDKINKHFNCSTGQMAGLMWDAKVNIIAMMASKDIGNLAPVHLMAMYLFTSDNKVCNFINEKLIDFKETDPWTSYIYCLYQGLQLVQPFGGECYRKINMLFYAPINTEINWTTFGIASSDWGNIQLDTTSTVFIIKSKTGRKISEYSKNPQNNEIVFLPGTKFKVMNYYVNDLIVFGQENIRECTFGAKDKDIQKVIDGKCGLIVEIHEIDQ